ncbi:MAG: hypothetical protein M0C28_47390 [Candidatus Moduliflexus flocculans]|nr:hypothetical protein [Candidatus Moduliflexus flocculans]
MNKHIGDLQNPGDPYVIDKNAFFARSKDAWNGKVTLKSKYGLKIKTSLRARPVMKDNRQVCRTFVCGRRSSDYPLPQIESIDPFFNPCVSCLLSESDETFFKLVP